MKIKLGIVITASMLITINLFMGNSKTSKKKFLENISLMQANATEVRCDDCNSNRCVFTVEFPHGTVQGFGKGWLVVTN